MKYYAFIFSFMIMFVLALPSSAFAKHACVLGAPLENCSHERAECTDILTNQKVGSRNSSVTKLQNYLYLYRYFSVTPTGYFGIKTNEAVVSFQKAHGIEGTGFVGPITRAKIKSLSCSNLSPAPIATTTTPVTTQPVQGTSAWTSWTATKLSPLSDTAMAALKTALGAVGVNTNFATTTLTEQEIIAITKKFEQDYILNQ